MSTTSVVDTGAELRCIVCEKLGWCEHIKEYIQLEEDRDVMMPDLHVLLPVFPTYSQFTFIDIAEESYPGAALMEIDHDPDFGNSQRIALGFWNKGEGRLSMRRVVIDWLQSQYPGMDTLRCPSSTHTFARVNALSKMLNDGLSTYWPNAWAIHMEGACIPCIQLSGDLGDAVPDVTDKPPWRV